MCRTLFFLPHTILGFPLFGFWSWSLIAWLVGSGVAIMMMLKRGHAARVAQTIPTIVIVSVVLGVLLPRMEVTENGQVMGIAIRGYGVMMLIAFLTGVGTAMYRATQVRLNPEVLIALATWMFVGGIVGARLFFVVQKCDEFAFESPLDMIIGFVNLAEGGLVVYGSFFGAMAGMAVVLYRYQLPALPVCDLISASMMFGLAIGRVGCLMNGCCYGGVCDRPWAITFPTDSPPYFDQLYQGRLHGFLWELDEQGIVTVRQVHPGSAAEKAGLREGDVLVAIGGRALERPEFAKLEPRARDEAIRSEVRRQLAEVGRVIRVQRGDGSSLTWQVSPWPERSLPVHPTQIYSAINALLLGLLLWFIYPFRRRDGQVFATLLGCYAVARFTLEAIRTDEASFAGTGLTIAQNVSLLLGAMAMVLGMGIAWWRRPLWHPPGGSR